MVLLCNLTCRKKNGSFYSFTVSLMTKKASQNIWHQMGKQLVNDECGRVGKEAVVA
jgi:hypothetical protein